GREAHHKGCLRRSRRRQLGQEPRLLRRHGAGQREEADRPLAPPAGEGGLRCALGRFSLCCCSPPASPAAAARTIPTTRPTPSNAREPWNAAANPSAITEIAAMTGLPWFAYRDNELHAEGVPLSRIAAEVGTPAYVYSHQALEDRYRSLSDAFAGTDHLIAYAVKANASLAVLRVFARLGAGADVVSGGELQLALKAGIPAGKIIFAGVGKTREEMALGLKHGIAQFNVESEAELEALSEVAKAQGKEAPIAIRINPDVDARTHRKITTGKAENKFGIAYQRAGEVYALAARLPGIRVIGVHVHIGSQLIDLEPYESTFERVAELVTSLRRAGHDIRRVDLGGGIGIRYNGETPPDPRDYAALVRKHILPLGCEIALEPGRYLVGNAGLLLSRVTFVKRTATKSFLILD